MSEQGRLALRLATLSHDALVQLAAQLCAGSPAARNTADAVIAAEQPVPQWAVEGVLLLNGDGDLLCADGAGQALADAAGWTYRGIAGAGHAAPLEQPVEWRREVLGFLDAGEDGVRLSTDRPRVPLGLGRSSR